MNARFKKNRFLALQPSAQAAMFVVAITGFILPAAVTAQGMDHSRMGHGGMDHSQMDHGQINPGAQSASPAPKASPVAPASAPQGAMPGGMNHCGMDHSQMNHGQMRHGPSPAPAAPPAPQAAPAAPAGMNHQGMNHGSMNHGAPSVPPSPKATPAAPASAPHGATPGGMNHGGMDHSRMNHGGMDHSQMNHGTAPAAAPKVDPVHAGHGAAPAPAAPADRSSHTAPPAGASAAAQMDHGPMQGGRPPADARDPNAYSDGQVRGSGPYSLPGVPPLQMHDQHSFASLHVNRLEHAWPRHGRSFTTFEGELRVGRGAHQGLLKAEGEVARGRLHEAHTELLWGYAIAPFWNTQLGLRLDGGEGPNRTWLAFGVEGTAPYNVETRATAYLGSSGRAALRLELAYDAYLTQKLVLQPRTEWQLYAKDDVERGIGKGLTSVSAGLRLRYEITPQIAPYVGVEWQRGFGRTAELLRASGERASNTRWVAGLSFWF